MIRRWDMLPGGVFAAATIVNSVACAVCRRIRSAGEGKCARPWSYPGPPRSIATRSPRTRWIDLWFTPTDRIRASRTTSAGSAA